MDTLLLSRLQFAANISFHILFPTITIALGWLLLFFRLTLADARAAQEGKRRTTSGPRSSRSASPSASSPA